MRKLRPVALADRAAFYESLLAERRQLGLSLKAFGAKKGIPYTTLQYWERRFRRQPDGAHPSFVAVRAPLPAARPEDLAIELPNGVRLRVPPSYPAEALRVLLALVQTPC